MALGKLAFPLDVFHRKLATDRVVEEEPGLLEDLQGGRRDEPRAFQCVEQEPAHLDGIAFGYGVVEVRRYGCARAFTDNQTAQRVRPPVLADPRNIEAVRRAAAVQRPCALGDLFDPTSDSPPTRVVFLRAAVRSMLSA